MKEGSAIENLLNRYNEIFTKLKLINDINRFKDLTFAGHSMQNNEYNMNNSDVNTLKIELHIFCTKGEFSFRI